MGRYLQQALERIKIDHPVMGDVRGCGLFTGIEWVSEDQQADPNGAIAMANKLKEKGFLLSNAGALKNVLKVRPPLVFEQQHADQFLAAFTEILADG